MTSAASIQKRPLSPACGIDDLKIIKKYRQSAPICLHCNALGHTWVDCVVTQCTRCSGLHPKRRCPSISLVHYLPQGFETGCCIGSKQSVQSKPKDIVERGQQTNMSGASDAPKVSFVLNLCEETPALTSMGTASNAVPLGCANRLDNSKPRPQMVNNEILQSANDSSTAVPPLGPTQPSVQSPSKGKPVMPQDVGNKTNTTANQGGAKTVASNKIAQQVAAKLPDNKICALPPSSKDFAIERFPQLSSVYTPQPFYRMETVSKATMDSFRSRILNALQICGAQRNRPLPEEAKKLRWVAASEAAEMLRFWLGYVCEKHD